MNSLFFRPLLLCLISLTIPSLVHAATRNVPSATYPTIKSAVDAAQNGDTVLVAAGTYSGPGNRDIDFNGKSLVVTSQAGPSSTIIDCGGYKTTDGSGNHRGFYLHSGEVSATISGFTVKNGYETYVSSIPDSGSGGGICSKSSRGGTLTLTNCTVSGNTASTGNAAAHGGGIYNYGGTTTLTNSIFYGDTGGEVVNGTGTASILFSDIQGGYPGTSNIDKDPLFVNAAYGDLHLKPGSPCIGAGTAAGAPATDKDGNLRRSLPSMGAYEGAGQGAVLPRPAGTLTLYDAGYDASHVDLSDNAVGPVDIARLSSDTQICGGAAADGATKILLRYDTSAPGTVAFSDTGSVSGDKLLPINTTTQLIDGQNVAFAVYTVPESLDTTAEGHAQPSHFVRHDVTFQVVFTPTTGAGSTVSQSLTLESPPVLLIHGLWSSADDTWNKTGGVRDALIAAGYVSGRSLFLVNYSDTNTATLNANQAVPLLNAGGIRDAHQVYQSNGIAMTRVDMVGHSMGGLVTRKFAAWSAYSVRRNFHKGYVRRMITIGTPHLGSPLGTYLYELHTLFLAGPIVDSALHLAKKDYGPAIEDLKPGGSGLASLGTTNIPCFAEVGNYDVQHLSDLTSFYNILLFFSYKLRIGNSPSLSQLDAVLFQGQTNDAVVPIPSQEDGLPSSFYNTYGLTNHLQETGSSVIGADVVRLVTGPLSNFSTGFQAASHTSAVASHLQSPHDAPIVAPFVTITTPTAGQVFHPGDTLTVTLTPNAGTALTQALVQAGASPRDVGSALLSQSPYTATFTVPPAALGILPVMVTAKDAAGNVCTVTVNALVQTNAALSSMTVAAGATAPSGAAILTSQGSTNPLTVTGTFSDATYADITSSALGTYYVSGDPTIAAVSADGGLTALADGTVTVTVTNGSVTATQRVIVQLGTPNILRTAPASAAPGATLTLTLTGTDFGGASLVQFLANGVPDPNITVSGIQNDTPGNILTATVTVKPNAIPGRHTLTVTTPGGQSDPQAAPDAAGFTVISPLNTHVLWNNVNGAASIWNYSPADGSYTHQEYGPYTGYTAAAIADGSSDSKTRVLWDKTDGSASIWSLDNTTGQFAHFEFGPFTDYTATALSVATDNTTHVLWTNTDGSVSVWNYAAASGGYTHKEYGPFAGWTAKAIADSPDGKSRLLWTKTDGTMSLWSFDNSTGAYTHFEYGPFAGWTAGSVSVGGDNTTHVLWTNTNGAASVWNENLGSGSYTHQEYGPYIGWTANTISDGADGKQRVLWDNADGRMSLWSLDNVTGVFGQFTYGGFSGWTANAISGF